jgi:hypothetical protein
MAHNDMSFRAECDVKPNPSAPIGHSARNPPRPQHERDAAPDQRNLDNRPAADK